MKFEFQNQIPPSFCDYRIQEMYSAAMYSQGKRIGSDQFEQRFEALASKMERQIHGPPVWLLGHPFFTQEDVRTPAPIQAGTGDDSEESSIDWLSLLSFDSNGDDLFGFGDAGAATVLVPATDLSELNLARTWYSWDCY